MLRRDTEHVHAFHISDVYVQTREVFSERKLLYVETTLSGALNVGKLEFTLLNAQGIDLDDFSCELNGKQRIDVVHGVYDVCLWELQTPTLYTLKIELKYRAEVYDTVYLDFGFKYSEFRYEGFYLNGNKFKLLGALIDDTPRELDKWIELADTLKNKLFMNLAVLSCPAPEVFLKRCDQIGLMVFEGLNLPIETGKEKDDYLEKLREMIVNHRNHVSLVLLGIRPMNVPDCDSFFVQTLALANQLSNLQTAGIRNVQKSNLLEDVYVYYEYVSGNKSIKPKAAMGREAPYLAIAHTDGEFISHARAIGCAFGNFNTCGIVAHSLKDLLNDDLSLQPTAYVYASQESDQPMMSLIEPLSTPPAYVFTNMSRIELYAHEKLIKEFYKDNKALRYMHNPPIVIDDFLGDTLLHQEKMMSLTSWLLKKYFIKQSKFTGFLLNILGVRPSKLSELKIKYGQAFHEGVEQYLLKGFDAQGVERIQLLTSVDNVEYKTL